MTERHKSEAIELYARPLRHAAPPPPTTRSWVIILCLDDWFALASSREAKRRGAFIGNGVSALIRLFLTLQVTTQSWEMFTTRNRKCIYFGSSLYFVIALWCCSRYLFSPLIGKDVRDDPDLPSSS